MAKVKEAKQERKGKNKKGRKEWREEENRIKIYSREE